MIKIDNDSVRDKNIKIFDFFSTIFCIILIGTFKFMGVAMVAYEGMMTILPIRSSMQNKTKMKSVSILTVLLFTILTISMT